MSDRLRRDSSWQMILPGAYIDPDGCGHLFPDEVVAFLKMEHPEAGFDFTKDDYDLIVERFRAAVLEQCPGIEFKFMKHEREAD